MVRLLPGVYTSINDLSSIPEGSRSLVVGAVIQSNKGKLGEAVLQVSPQDFLASSTYTGKVLPNDDKTFYTCINVLQETNQLYTVRAAKNALYGGLVIKKEELLGDVLSISTSKIITVVGDVSSKIASEDSIRIKGISSTLDNVYTVEDVEYVEADTNTQIKISETVTENYTYASGVYPSAFKSRQPVSFNQELIGTISSVNKADNKIIFTGDLLAFLPVGDKIEIKESTLNNDVYTIVSNKYDNTADTTTVVLKEALKDNTVGKVYRNSIVDPESYAFKPEDLCIITGVDQGKYNGLLAIKLVSTKDSDTLVEPNVFSITVIDTLTNAQLESFLVSKNKTAKATDGTPLYLETVVNENSNYIKVIDNNEIGEDELPCSTLHTSYLSGGYDGDTLTDSDLVEALNVFRDKTIPISILVNGSIETPIFQQAMIQLTEDRKDVFAFLNTRLIDEKATTNSKKAANVVNYKKQYLSSSSFMNRIDTPHVTIPDIFNSREIVVGADAKIVPGWLNVIRTKGYPTAFAGPRNGKVEGIKTNWKIGDASGEGVLLNDASVNFIAYDAKQGRYIEWTQNTLQIANSALRNTATILNVLDIKETLAADLKEYLQLGITDDLRKEILTKVRLYMNIVKSNGRVSDFAFVDVSTKQDISDNKLKFVLTLAPVGYAQEIYLVMNIVNQTYDFSILQKL